MVERAAKAVYERNPNGGYVITGHGTAAHANDFRPDAWEDAPDRHEQCRDIARGVIEALMEPTAETTAAVLAWAEATDAGDWSDERAVVELYQAFLRTALPQPNEEGEGK